MTIKEILSNPTLLDKYKKPKSFCADCSEPLSMTLTGCHKVKGRLLCDDCYYSELGECLKGPLTQ